MVVEREKIDNGFYRIVADIIDDLEHNPDVSTTMEKCAYIRGVLDMKKKSLEWIDVLETKWIELERKWNKEEARREEAECERNGEAD